MLQQFIQHFAGSSEFARQCASLDKITFRGSLAAVMAFVLALSVGPFVIRWLKARFQEPLESRSEVLQELHKHKQATPTMGGLFVMLAIVGGVFLFGDLSNAFLLLAVGLLLALTTLGVVDDWTKLRNGKGLSARVKLALQVAIALAIAIPVYLIHYEQPRGLDLVIPLTTVDLSLGLWFIPLATLVLVGSANAVNLTDGLDGLASGCLIFAFAAIGVLAYAAGHIEMAEYFGVIPIRGAGELTILIGATAGALLGFLWFNCQPAQVFMGDTGSLPLGGLLGFVAIVSRQELLLVVIGGVFVVEAISVIAQVSFFKMRGRRILLCAPLHHHFQFRGWPESRVVTRFWIASILCAVLGLVGARITGSLAPSNEYTNAATEEPTITTAVALPAPTATTQR